MTCPACGAEMNRHAEKLVTPAGPADEAWDEAWVDPVLGGIVDELYACPACGTSASRRVSPR
jgi:hypothetical protein